MASLLMWLVSWWLAPALEFQAHQKAVWVAHSTMVLDVYVSSGGNLIVSRSDDGALKLWDAGNHSQIQTDFAKGMVFHRCEVSEDGAILAAVDQESVIHIFDLEERKLVSQIVGLRGRSVWAMSLSPDGKWLAANTSSSANRTITTWSTRDGKPGPFAPMIGAPFASRMCFGPGKTQLLTAHRNEDVVYGYDLQEGKRIAEYRAGRVLKRPGHDSKRPEKILLSPDKRHVLVSTWLGRVVEWNAATQTVTRVMQAHQNGLTFSCFALSADGETLVTAQNNGQWSLPSHLRVWRFRDWKLLGEIRTPRPWARFDDKGWSIMSLAISPDARWIACGHAKGHITILQNPNKAQR